MKFDFTCPNCKSSEPSLRGEENTPFKDSDFYCVECPECGLRSPFVWVARPGLRNLAKETAMNHWLFLQKCYAILNAKGVR